MGKHKKAECPFEVSEKIRFRDAWVVMPFILKGKILKKYKPSPFFKEDGVTQISDPVILE